MQFNQKTFHENLLAILRADYAKEIKNATAKELCLTIHSNWGDDDATNIVSFDFTGE